MLRLARVTSGEVACPCVGCWKSCVVLSVECSKVGRANLVGKVCSSSILDGAVPEVIVGVEVTHDNCIAIWEDGVEGWFVAGAAAAAGWDFDVY